MKINDYQSPYIGTESRQQYDDGSSIERKKDSIAELQSKYPNLSITSGVGIKWKHNNKTNNVIIHPNILAQMENDENVAKENMERLSGIEAAFRISDTIAALSGGKVIYRCDYIDENGEVWGGAVVVYRESLNERLRRETAENIQKRIDKSIETGREKKEKIIEKLEQKMADALKDGKGKVEFDKDEMKALIKEAKRRGLDTKIDIKV